MSVTRLKILLDEVDQSSWYNSSEALDQEIRDRFLETWHQIMEGGHSMCRLIHRVPWPISWSRINFRAICFADQAGFCLGSACVDSGKTMRDAEMGSLH